MTTQPPHIRNILEAALLAAGRPLKLDELMALFSDAERPARNQIRQALDELQSEFAGRGIELKEVGSGFRIQVKAELAPWMARLWEERPARYSRALLETLSLIAYRQPITRGEIEAVRGVTVSPHIVRTLEERGWIRVVGHRDVPGHPEMFGTTKEFLDYFSLRSLDELPTLADIRDIASLEAELDFDGAPPAQVAPAAEEPGAQVGETQAE
jgi:segregation and condensation protein B